MRVHLDDAENCLMSFRRALFSREFGNCNTLVYIANHIVGLGGTIEVVSVLA